MVLKISAAAVAAALITSLPASAALIVLEKPAAPVASTGGFLYQGTAPGTQTSGALGASGVWYDKIKLKSIVMTGVPPHQPIPSLIGQGRQVKLSDALAQVVPRQFAVHVPPADSSTLVDWRASGNWLAAVDELIFSRRMSAVLDWRALSLSLKSAPVTVQVPTTGATPSSTFLTGVTPATQPSSSPLAVKKDAAPVFASSSNFVAPKPVPVQVWKAEMGTTLRETFAAWGKRANWNVVWDVSLTNVDYPIDAAFVQSGDFLSAIQKTVELYKKASTPLYADAYPEQRLVIITGLKDKEGSKQ
ncbi:toxin co-regulated pilus biosynthesis Q family protein [Aeromonas veronii]|uniref:toxin co-regulated pilus biosynthesis Q family protein n=1 Tax=Aeromonas veronii TaxID=654 RepID=UPI003158610A